jgi:ADP-ribose pyrophosphatase YjhB (NUDIX family)
MPGDVGGLLSDGESYPDCLFRETFRNSGHKKEERSRFPSVGMPEPKIKNHVKLVVRIRLAEISEKIDNFFSWDIIFRYQKCPAFPTYKNRISLSCLKFP